MSIMAWTISIVLSTTQASMSNSPAHIVGTQRRTNVNLRESRIHIMSIQLRGGLTHDFKRTSRNV